ncbi:Gfo/Idh/MocA family oxidoreductase [Streptomyces hygroscopicus]|uniref:Gfo/Idh/MocA family oxidoreductase n=1 Tax=Streptomyces hygroscopicus TaxID=1912 RepID=UPI00362F7D02
MALHHVAVARPPVRYGLIGPGGHAQEHLLPALSSLDGARLEAVAARRKSAAAQAAARWQARLYTDDWTELADPAVVDAVIVAASPAFHARVVEHCLSAGVGVFVEKPPAPDTATLEALVAAEAGAPPGAPVFVGFNFPYGTSYRKLLDRLRPHGQVRGFDLRMVSAKPLAPDWHHTTVTRSLLYGLGTHAIDMALRELGVPDAVTAHTAVIDQRRRAIRIVLGYADGRLATLHVGNHSNRLEYRCELITSQGVTGVLDQHNTLELTRPPGAPGVGLLDGKETLRHQWPSRRGGYERTGYAGELASFQRSLTEKLPSTSTLAACLDVYRVLDEVLRQTGDDGAREAV